MRLAEGIRKHGFSGWYSRELTQAHLHLLLLLLCAIGLFAALELLFRSAPVLRQVGNGVLLLLCAAGGLWALRRYIHTLMRAEGIAHQAVCPACSTYGRLNLVREHPGGEQLTVSCRKCAREWQLIDLETG